MMAEEMLKKAANAGKGADQFLALASMSKEKGQNDTAFVMARQATDSTRLEAMWLIGAAHLEVLEKILTELKGDSQ